MLAHTLRLFLRARSGFIGLLVCCGLFLHCLVLLTTCFITTSYFFNLIFSLSVLVFLFGSEVFRRLHLLIVGNCSSASGLFLSITCSSIGLLCSLLGLLERGGTLRLCSALITTTLTR